MIEPCTGSAPPLGYEVRIVDEPDNGYRSVRTLQVTRGGEVITAESDGGEPEDQSFYRDWSWVEPALKAAYAFGLEDGRGTSAATNWEGLAREYAAERNAANTEVARLIAELAEARLNKRPDDLRDVVVEKARAVMGGLIPAVSAEREAGYWKHSRISDSLTEKLAWALRALDEAAPCASAVKTSGSNHPTSKEKDREVNAPAEACVAPPVEGAPRGSTECVACQGSGVQYERRMGPHGEYGDYSRPCRCQAVPKACAEPESVPFPEDWDVQAARVKVEIRRVWVPLSETTAALLAAVLAHQGLSAESWISEKTIEEAAQTVDGGSPRAATSS